MTINTQDEIYKKIKNIANTTSELYSEELKANIREKLKIAEDTIAEIELINDKSRRIEWRELKKYVKWAKRIVD